MGPKQLAKKPSSVSPKRQASMAKGKPSPKPKLKRQQSMSPKRTKSNLSSPTPKQSAGGGGLKAKQSAANMKPKPKGAASPGGLKSPMNQQQSSPKRTEASPPPRPAPQTHSSPVVQDDGTGAQQVGDTQAEPPQFTTDMLGEQQPSSGAFNFSAVPPFDHINNPHYIGSNYRDYLKRATETSEAVVVCDDLLRSATSLYKDSKPEDYLWNDQFQMILRQSIANWQSAATWGQMDGLCHEFYAASINVAEQVYTGFTYGEPSTVVKNGCMFRIWGSYDEAKMYIQGFQRISQTLFEQNIDSIHTPVTILLTMHGIFMTVTAIPPIQDIQPIPYVGTGSLLAHMMSRLFRSLFLPPDVPPIPVHRGLDGRWYLMTFHNSLVVHDILKCRFPIPMLRQHYLKAGPQETMEEFADTTVAADVAQTIVETIEVIMKQEGKKNVNAGSLLGQELVTKSLKKHGANTRLLYRVIASLDGFQAQIKANPGLALKRKKPPIRKREEDYSDILAKAGLVSPTAAAAHQQQEELQNAPLQKKQSQLQRKQTGLTSPNPRASTVLSPPNSQLMSNDSNVIVVGSNVLGGGPSPATDHRRSTVRRKSAIKSPERSGEVPTRRPSQRPDGPPPALSVEIPFEESVVVRSEGTTTPTAQELTHSRSPETLHLTPTPQNKPLNKYVAFGDTTAASTPGTITHEDSNSISDGGGGGGGSGADHHGSPKTLNSFVAFNSAANLKGTPNSQGQQQHNKAKKVGFQQPEEKDGHRDSDLSKQNSLGKFVAFESSSNLIRIRSPSSSDDPHQRHRRSSSVGNSRRRHSSIISDSEEDLLMADNVPMPKLKPQMGGFLTGLSENEINEFEKEQRKQHAYGHDDDHYNSPGEDDDGGDDSQQPLQPKMSVAQMALLKRKMNFARTKTMKRLKEQEQQQGGDGATPKPKPKKELPTVEEELEGKEVVPVLVPTKQQAVDRKEVDAPIISEKAVILARQICQVEMSLRCVKAIIRAELVAPHNNQERYFHILSEQRVDLVNRIAHDIYTFHPNFFREVSRVARIKFGCPANFELPSSQVLAGYLIRHAPATIGAVYNNEANKFIRMKPIYKESTIPDPPLPLRMVFENNESLPQATIVVADEWDALKNIYAPGSITKLCAMQRTAYMGMLIMIKLSRTILEEMYNEAERQKDFDPYAILTTGALLAQAYGLSADTFNSGRLIRAHQDHLQAICMDVDLPYRSERDHSCACLMKDLDHHEEAAHIILDSVRCDDRMSDQGMFSPVVSSRHLEKCIFGIEYCFDVERYKNAQHLANVAIDLCEHIPPTDISIGDTSQALLGMPTKAKTRDDLIILRDIAVASLAFHERAFGKMAVETCTARNILAQFHLELEEDIPGEMRGDVLLGLQVLGGDGDILIEDAQPEVKEPTPEGQIGDVVQPLDPTSMTPEEAEAARPESTVAKVSQGKQLSAKPAVKTVSQKAKPSSMKRFEVLAQKRAANKETGLSPAQQRQMKKLHGTTKVIKDIGLRTQLLMKQLAQREKFWEEYLTSFLNVVDKELQGRKEICALQETEQREMITTAHDLQTRRMVTYMHEYFSHFITWQEHSEIIQLMEHEERHKGWLWEENDMIRIGVREEYMHRAVLWNVQLQTATSHLLTRCEFLERYAIRGDEDLHRRRLVLEAKTATVRQWEREEKRVRTRWHEGMEVMARREIYGREETALRKHMLVKEMQERQRLIQFMNFIGLEFGLRGIEYWENVVRTSQEWPAWQESVRLMYEIQEEDQRLVVHRYELTAREDLERQAMDSLRFASTVLGTFLNTEEQFGRHLIDKDMLEDSVFAAEMYEDHLRSMLEHEEIVDYDDILLAQQKEFMAKRYTPAMKKLEIEEAQKRRVLHGIWAGEVADMMNSYVEGTKAPIVAEEQHERQLLVGQLRGNLGSIFDIETAEIIRLEELFRSMVLADEQDSAQRLIVKEEAFIRRIIKNEANTILISFVQRQEDFFRGYYIREQYEEWMSVLACGYLAPISHAVALWYDQQAFRFIHVIVQDEIWARLDVVNDRYNDFAYLHCTCFEQVVRDQIISDWAIGWAWICCYFEVYCAATRRVVAWEEQEFQHRSTMEMEQLAHWVFEVEPRRREVLIQEELQLRLLCHQDALADYKDLNAITLAHFELYEESIRYGLDREEQDERGALLRLIAAEKPFLRQLHLERKAIETEWFLDLEPLHRRFIELRGFTLMLEKCAWIDRRKLKLNRRDELASQTVSSFRDMIALEHVTSRAILKKMWVNEAEILHRSVIQLHERGWREEIEYQADFSKRSIERRSHSLFEVEVYEEEFRSSLCLDEASAFSTLLQQQEGDWRHGIIGYYEAKQAAIITQGFLHGVIEIEQDEAAPSLIQQLEMCLRQGLQAEEESARDALDDDLHHRNVKITGTLAVKLNAREIVARNRIAMLMFFEQEAFFRDMIIREYYALFFARLESNRKTKRAKVEEKEQMERLVGFKPFVEPAMKYIPFEELHHRHRLIVEEGMQRKQVLLDGFWLLHQLEFEGRCRASIAANVLMPRAADISGILLQLAERQKRLAHREAQKESIIIAEATKRGYWLIAEAKQTKEHLALLHHTLPLLPMAAASITIVEEPVWRNALSYGLLRQMKLLRLSEFELREGTFRQILHRSRRRWERQHVYTQWKLRFFSTMFNELRPRLLIMRAEIRWCEFYERQELQRKMIWFLEWHRRRVFLCGQEVAQRHMIDKTHSMTTHFIEGCELNIRTQMMVRETYLRGLMVANTVCWHGWIKAAEDTRVRQAWELFTAVEPCEFSWRKALVEEQKRRRREVYFEGFFSCISLPFRRKVERWERTARVVLIDWYDMPQKEHDARAEIIAAWEAQFNTIQRKEAAWKECIIEWERDGQHRAAAMDFATSSPLGKQKASAAGVNTNLVTANAGSTSGRFVKQVKNPTPKSTAVPTVTTKMRPQELRPLARAPADATSFLRHVTIAEEEESLPPRPSSATLAPLKRAPQPKRSQTSLASKSLQSSVAATSTLHVSRRHTTTAAVPTATATRSRGGGGGPSLRSASDPPQDLAKLKQSVAKEWKVTHRVKAKQNSVEEDSPGKKAAQNRSSYSSNML